MCLGPNPFSLSSNGAGRFFSPTDPNLANILGDTFFDFENFYLLACSCISMVKDSMHGKEDSMDGEGFNG